MDNLDMAFNDSYAHVMANSDSFYRLFYKNFFESSAEVREMFLNVDMKQQRNMLKKSVVHMVNFFVNKSASPYLYKLAERHQKMQITDKMYEQWMSALIKTLKTFDPHFDGAREAAWHLTMAPGIAFMRRIEK